MWAKSVFLSWPAARKAWPGSTMSHSFRPLPSRRHGRQPRVAATVVAADDYSAVAATKLPSAKGKDRDRSSCNEEVPPASGFNSIYHVNSYFLFAFITLDFARYSCERCSTLTDRIRRWLASLQDRSIDNDARYKREIPFDIKMRGLRFRDANDALSTRLAYKQS